MHSKTFLLLGIELSLSYMSLVYVFAYISENSEFKLTCIYKSKVIWKKVRVVASFEKQR